MESHHTFLKSAYVHYVRGDASSLNTSKNNTAVVNQHQDNETSGDTGQRMSWDTFPSHMQIATCHSRRIRTCEKKMFFWIVAQL